MHDLNWRAKQVYALEKKRPFLLEEERVALIGRNLWLIGLDFPKIGVYGRTETDARRQPEFRSEPRFGLQRLVEPSSGLGEHRLGCC